MDPDIDVCQTEQPQISYSVDFTAEQSSAMGSPLLLGREGIYYRWCHLQEWGTVRGRQAMDTCTCKLTCIH